MTDAKNLYERDFFLWTETQADALRAAASGSTNQALDWENLAEEIESLGRSDRRELRSQIHRIIRHLAKLQLSLATEPRHGWRESIADARMQAEYLLADSPSLKPQLGEFIAAETPKAIKRAIFDLGAFGEIDTATERALRHICYSVDQILGDWFPLEPTPAPGPAEERERTAPVRRRRGGGE